MKPRRRDDEESQAPRAPISDILRRRGAWGVVAFLLVIAPTVSLITFLPDIYRSAATVLIERQQIPDDLVKSTVTSVLEVRLQTISQEILSRSRLEEMIARHGLYQDDKKAPTEQIIEQMREDVKIELRGADRRADRATVAFTVSYRGRDAQKVALVANALASSYIEENLKIRERQAAGTADFLRNQLDELSRKLKDLEQKVGTFKERHLGQLPEQLDANLKTLEQLTTQLRLNGDNLTRASDRKGTIERQLAEALGSASPAGPDARATRLAQLRGALSTLQTRYSDRHPDVIRVRSEIETLEASLGPGETNGGGGAIAVTPALQQLKNSLNEIDSIIRGLEVEGGSLRRQIAIYQGRVETAPRVQQDYQALAREYETTQEMYKSLTIRQRESALAESMEQRQKGEQFRVIEPALPTERPAAPKRPRLYLLALAVAVAAAAAAILGPEALDSSVHSLDQLQARTSLPVLVSIPTISSPALVKRRRKRVALLVMLLMLALGGMVAGAYVMARGNWALTGMMLR